MQTPTGVFAFLAVGIAAACTGSGRDSVATSGPSPDAGQTGSTDTSPVPLVPVPSVTWGPDAVELGVADGAGGWWFGMAETTGCEDCWTGEDCVYGYESGDGAIFAHCHDAADSGTSLTYGGSRSGLAAGSTAFPDASHEARVTYFLESDPEHGGDGSCWVWGADISYFDGLLCGQP